MPSLTELHFGALCRTARVLFDATVVFICVEKHGFYWEDFAADAYKPDWTFIQSKGIHLFSDRSTIIVENALTDKKYSNSPYVIKTPNVRSIACTSFGPDNIGRLGLFDTRENKFNPEKLKQLGDITTIADQYLRLLEIARDATEQESLFRLITETSTDTIVRGDLDGVRLYVSPSIKELLGYTQDELVGRQAIEITHPEDVPALRSLLQEVHDGRKEVARVELRQKHKNGAWIWMEAAIRLTHDFSTGKPNGYVTSVREIGRRKKLEAELEQLASYDQLTGLPNRTQFDQELLKHLNDLKTNNIHFVIFYMDIDEFKEVNDNLGHQAGDAVLREVATRFLSTVRTKDIVARLGGDEFAAILEMDHSEAVGLAERLIRALSESFRYEDVEISIGLSIGITSVTGEELDPDILLSYADKALYTAKKSGKNTFRFFGDPD